MHNVNNIFMTQYIIMGSIPWKQNRIHKRLAMFQLGILDKPVHLNAFVPCCCILNTATDGSLKSSKAIKRFHSKP